MHRLRAVLLRHHTGQGSHYDLLIENPALNSPSHGPLWAARLDRPSHAWRDDAVIRLSPLPPHRRRYLAYQGPLTAGRGRVHRVDRGHAIPLLWTPSRLVLVLSLEQFQGRLTLRRLSPTLWQGQVFQRGLRV